MSAKSFPNRPGVYSNVAVSDNGKFRNFQLHRTIVVSYDRAQDLATLATGGWSTPTTRMAINRALEHLNFKGRVAVRDGELRYFGADGLEVRSIDLYPLTVRRDGSVAGSDAVSYPELAV